MIYVQTGSFCLKIIVLRVYTCIYWILPFIVNAADNKQRDGKMNTIKIVIDPYVMSNHCNMFHDNVS